VDWQSNARVWTLCRYKNRNKKGDTIDLLPVNTKAALLKLTDKSPLAKCLSVIANPIKKGMASRNFVSFLWILGPIFWSKISKLLFVIQMKFLNPEPPSICNSRRRLCRAEPPRPQTFHNFGGFFPPVTNAASRYPAHIPAGHAK